MQPGAPTPFEAALAGGGFVLERQLLGTNARGVAITRAGHGRVLVTLVDPGADQAALAEHRGWDLPLREAAVVTTDSGRMLRIVEDLPAGVVEATAYRARDAAGGSAGDRPTPAFVATIAERVAEAHAAGRTVGRLHESLVFVDPEHGTIAGIAQRPLRATGQARIPDGVPPMLDATYLSPAEFRGEPPSAPDDVHRLATVIWHWRHGQHPLDGVPRTARIPMVAGHLDPPAIDGDELDLVLWSALGTDPARRPAASAILAAVRSAPSW